MVLGLGRELGCVNVCEYIYICENTLFTLMHTAQAEVCQHEGGSKDHLIKDFLSPQLSHL